MYAYTINASIMHVRLVNMRDMVLTIRSTCGGHSTCAITHMVRSVGVALSVRVVCAAAAARVNPTNEVEPVFAPCVQRGGERRKRRGRTKHLLRHLDAIGCDSEPRNGGQCVGQATAAVSACGGTEQSEEGRPQVWQVEIIEFCSQAD